MILLFLAIFLAPCWTPQRIEVSLYVAAVAWDLDPATFEALAKVESELQINPRRYGTGKRWGDPPHGKRWRICGLLQLRGGMTGAGGFRIPDCSLLTISPELSAWYGAAHLRGWQITCSGGLMVEAYNTGKCIGGVPRPFQVKVWKTRQQLEARGE